MNQQAQTQNLRLTSTAFENTQPIPEQYTCKGQDVNPPLNITDVPEPTKSLALIVHDPDAPSGDFVHWTMWDIRPSVSSILANSVPMGAIQGVNSAGDNRYMGPCPPAGTGTHRYIFELYALDTSLGLPASTDRQQLEKSMNGHVIARATLSGVFAGD